MKLVESIKKIPNFSLLRAVARDMGISIWLVGGYLRDLYLKKAKDLVDFDFCVERDVAAVVAEFSKRTKSKFIVLDEAQGSFRVILKAKNKNYTYDFTLMRGRDIKEDISLRDFSINMLALDINDPRYALIDFFNARRDLTNKCIRLIREEVLRQDPLRILRGFSFMANYGFHIEPGTKNALKRYKSLLRNVSRERVNEELFKIVSSSRAYQTIVVMDGMRVLDKIIPLIACARGVHQGGYHHLDVWKHSLETLRQFELLIPWISRQKEVADYFDQIISGNRKRIHIVKIACLLHDIGKPNAKKKKNKKTIFYSHETIGRDLAEKIAMDLRFSLKEKDLLKRLIFWHLRPGYLAETGKPTQRAVYRFFRDTQEEGVATIVLALADWRATRGPLTSNLERKKHERALFRLIKKYFLDKKTKPIVKLVNGYEIMRKFDLLPSPLIGKILAKIREEQALGRITTKAQAYKVAMLVIKLPRNIDVRMDQRTGALQKGPS